MCYYSSKHAVENTSYNHLWNCKYVVLHEFVILYIYIQSRKPLRLGIKYDIVFYCVVLNVFESFDMYHYNKPLLTVKLTLGVARKIIRISWPPIHLLLSINQYFVMKKRDLFVVKERDLKFNKSVKFSLSVANLRNQAMLYGSLDIYLRHTLIILSGNIN